jgi:hypothetical protein
VAAELREGGEIAIVRSGLTSAEGQTGDQKRQALAALQTRMTGKAGGARDKAKVRMLADALRELADAR